MQTIYHEKRINSISNHHQTRNSPVYLVADSVGGEEGALAGHLRASGLRRQVGTRVHGGVLASDQPALPDGLRADGGAAQLLHLGGGVVEDGVVFGGQDIEVGLPDTLVAARLLDDEGVDQLEIAQRREGVDQVAFRFRQGFHREDGVMRHTEHLLLGLDVAGGLQTELVARNGGYFHRRVDHASALRPLLEALHPGQPTVSGCILLGWEYRLLDGLLQNDDPLQQLVHLDVLIPFLVGIFRQHLHQWQ